MLDNDFNHLKVAQCLGKIAVALCVAQSNGSTSSMEWEKIFLIFYQYLHRRFNALYQTQKQRKMEWKKLSLEASKQ